MALKIGLVGLPNVGKSTLFNALTKSTIAAQNFPFCTIDPNVAITPVPDARMSKLASIFGSKSIIPCSINFVDIAGLVKGASQGQGLGNQFLSHIMEVDLILHVLRFFEDGDILHVNDKISPLDDFDVIMTELAFKDLDSIEKRDAKLIGLIKKTSDPKQKKLFEEEQKINIEIKKALDILDYQKVKDLCAAAKEAGVFIVPLLTAKDFLVATNFSEAQLQNKAFENTDFYKNAVQKFGKERVVPVCAKLEEDLSRMSDDEQMEMRKILEMDEAGFNTLIYSAFKRLDMITFFTCGPKEIHAWAVKNGTKINNAAGEIHSDLERGFICAEVYNYNELVAAGSEVALKNTGKIKTEGKDYITKDGDIVLIRFNV